MRRVESSLPPSSPPPRAQRLLSGPFLALSVADLGYFTAAGLAIFTLPLFATGPVGTDEAGAGLAFGAFSVTALLLRPYAGRLTDSWGRRPLLLFGTGLAAAAMLGHLVADSLLVLVGLRLVLGVAEAAFFVAGFAAIADLAPEGRAGEALSYSSLGLYVGIAVGPLLGEALIRIGGYDLAWIGASALCLLSGVLVVALIPETRGDDDADPGPTPLIHRRAIAPSLAFATGLAAIFGFMSLASLRAEELALDVASTVLFGYGLVVVICRVAFARVPDRYPPLIVAGLSLLVIASGLALAGLTSGAATLLVATALVAVGVAFMTPAFFAAIFATAAPRQRGAASGTASLFMDLGFGGGPMVLGLVAAAADIPLAFIVGAGLATVAAASTRLVSRTLPPAASPRTGSPSAG